MTANVFAEKHGKTFSIFNVDTVEFTTNMPTETIDLTVYSPPFAHLFVYSDSDRDMGNVGDYAEFKDAYRVLVREIIRITKPGRISAVHCSDIPTTKSKNGVIGLFDLPALIREAHEEEGWVYHSRVTIWKDPVVEMQRTKAHGLLYKTFRTDATRCRAGMPDYMMIFRKPINGANEKTVDPVKHDPNQHPVTVWQEIASPVWMTIDQTDVLNARIARDDKDERHLCPLQLDVIERCLTLYTNPGDTVYSPFLGIGSEGFQSLRMGRRFIGTELKPSYFRQACKYLEEAERLGPSHDLLSDLGRTA
jgi:DNA modification methylase